MSSTPCVTCGACSAAEWQESTKHGRSLTFGQFLADVLEAGPEGVVGRWFWSVHDAVDVLRRGVPGCRPSGCTWSPCRPPEPTPARCGPVRGRARHRPASASTRRWRVPTRRSARAEVTFLRQVNEALASGNGRKLEQGERGRTSRACWPSRCWPGGPASSGTPPRLSASTRYAAVRSRRCRGCATGATPSPVTSPSWSRRARCGADRTPTRSPRPSSWPCRRRRRQRAGAARGVAAVDVPAGAGGGGPDATPAVLAAARRAAAPDRQAAARQAGAAVTRAARAHGRLSPGLQSWSRPSSGKMAVR